jgi:drug/metabolite transporter (DMT)-like permease
VTDSSQQHSPAEQQAVSSPADWARLALPGLVWGTSFYFIAEGLRSFDPTLITPMRVGFGFLTLSCFRAARAPIRQEDRSRVVLLGLIWLAVPLTLFPFAEQRVSSSVTGMLNGATPLFVASVASLLARRLPPMRQLAGLAIGFGGVVLIAIPTLNEGRSSLIGVAMIVAALLCYGFALNLAVPLQQRNGALPVLWRAQAVAAIVTLPFGIPHIGEAEVQVGPMLAVVALGVFGTAIAFLAAAANAGRFGSTRTSVTAYLIPVVALALGAVVRDEHVAALAVIGCAVAVLGAYVAGRAGSTSPASPAPPATANAAATRP